MAGPGARAAKAAKGFNGGRGTVRANAIGMVRPEEIVELSLLIATINAWNRIAIGFRAHHPHDRA